jgi:hypothetical protein
MSYKMPMQGRFMPQSPPQLCHVCVMWHRYKEAGTANSHIQLLVLIMVSLMYVGPDIARDVTSLVRETTRHLNQL